MKKLILAITALCALQPSVANAMDKSLVPAHEEKAIVHDFLHNHNKFKALWGTVEKNGTCYYRLPKEIAQIIIKKALAPALPMLKKALPIQTTEKKENPENANDFSIGNNGIYLLKKYRWLHEWIYLDRNWNLNQSKYNNNAQLLITVNYKTGNAEIWDIDLFRSWLNDPDFDETTIKILKELEPKHILKDHTQITALNLNNKSTLAVTASENGTATIWNVETGQLLHTLKVNDGSGGNMYIPTQKIHCAQFDSTGNLLATCYDYTVKVWDVNTRTCLQTITDSNQERTCLIKCSFSKNRGLLATSTGQAVQVWHIDTGNLLHQFNPSSIGKMNSESFSEWDFESYLNAIETLEKQLSFEQALLLNCIYHTAMTDKLIAKRGKNKNIKFDFNKFPHLRSHFESLPQLVQEGLMKHVILQNEINGDDESNNKQDFSDAADEQECTIL